MSVEGVGTVGWQRIDRTLLSIQYLRALAAIAVLVAHGLPNLPQLPISLLGLAMDLFFLMSGFLVIVISSDETRPLDFFGDRLARIVPLYWTLTFAAFVLIYSGILFPILDPGTIATRMAGADWAFLVRSLLFIPGSSPFEPDLNPLIPQGWTLNYEMMFYALFAAALFLPRRYLVPVVSVGFGVLVALGILLKGGEPFRFWTSPMIFEFVFGLWVGLAWQRRWNYGLVFLGLMLAWLPLMAVTEQYFLDAPFTPQRMQYLPFVLALFIACVALDRARGGLPLWNPAKLVGDASYSIYLVHFFPIILLDRVGAAVPIAPAAYFAVVVAGGLASGLATFHLVERPMMRLVRSVRAARRARPLRGLAT